MSPNRRSQADSVGAPSILSKAFELLRCFDSATRVMTLSELAVASDLPKSTVHRLLARLVDLDAVEPHRDGYKLSLGLMPLGAATPDARLHDLAMPYLISLHMWAGAAVELAVLRDLEVVCVAKLALPDAPAAFAYVGARMPAQCLAVGKVLLAWEDLGELAERLPHRLTPLTPASISDPQRLITQLRTVRNSGLAHDRDEARLGLTCLASPIVVDDVAVAGLSIGHRVDSHLRPQTESALRDTAARIAHEVRASAAG